MSTTIIYLVSSLSVSVCPSSGYAPGSPMMIAPSEASIDGLEVEGRIRARGVVGLVSVPGTLSFRDGALVWAAQDTIDCSTYNLTPAEDGYRFAAEYRIENDEHVSWSGWTDGLAVRDVTAVWTRVEGDFIHDLLLPEQVTLHFRPDD
jgi:hypothetical protein